MRAALALACGPCPALPPPLPLESSPPFLGPAPAGAGTMGGCVALFIDNLAQASRPGGVSFFTEAQLCKMSVLAFGMCQPY